MIPDLQNYLNLQPKIILVGNKTDLERNRVITYEEGINFAQIHNLLFLETSAKKYLNIENIYNNLATAILNTPSIMNKALRPNSDQNQSSSKQLKSILYKENTPKCCK